MRRNAGSTVSYTIKIEMNIKHYNVIYHYFKYDIIYFVIMSFYLFGIKIYK